MIGETTLAMLYVPLLFYLFDRMAEGDDDKPARRGVAAAAAAARRCRAAVPRRRHAPCDRGGD